MNFLLEYFGSASSVFAYLDSVGAGYLCRAVERTFVANTVHVDAEGFRGITGISFVSTYACEVVIVVSRILEKS